MGRELREVVYVDGVRTAFGRAGPKGFFWKTRADDMGAKVVRELLRRNPTLPPERVDDVVFAATAQVGDQGLTLGRDIALLAGLPQSVPGYAIDRMCAGALTAVTAGAGQIAYGAADVVVAGGVEHMGHHPMGEEVEFNPRFLAERLVDDSAVSMGATAENLHDRFPQLTKEDADRFAVRSQQRAAAAWENGVMRETVVPMSVFTDDGWAVADRDQFLRPDTSMEGLAELPTPFRPGGRVTAGNSAGLTDGATASLLASEAAAEELGLEPRMRLVGFAFAGVEPELMGIGPIPATKRVLEQAGLTLDDVGLLRAERALRRPGAHLVRRSRRRPRGRAAQSVRRRDRLRPPARGDRRPPDGAARLWLPRAPGRALRADRAVHRHGHGRRRALGESRRRVTEPRTEFKLRDASTRSAGPLALVTVDNGADYTKPTVFGRSAFESAQRVLAELEDGDWAAMVLTGKPFVFAVGADMTEFPKVRRREEAIEGSRAGHDAFGRIRALPFPTVAAINGACLGGGVEIALHCDARTISSAVRHFAVPEVFLGIFPAWGGTQLVPRLVDPKTAVRFVVQNPMRQNRMLTGAEAVEHGLADRLLEPAEFLDESIAYALELVEAGLGPTAAGHVRAGRGRPPGAQPARRLRPRRRPGAVPGARPDRGLGELEPRGGLSRRGGGDRRPDAVAAGAGLAVRIRPRRAAREAGRGPARRRAAPGQEGRHRRRRLDGDAAGDAVPAAARGPGRAPRRQRGDRRAGTRVDPRRARRAGAARGATPRARRASSPRWPPARPATRTSPTATSCSRRCSRSWTSSGRSSPSSSGSSRPECVLATNTSSLSITDMASELEHPERVAGMHFFNPVAVLPLVEVIRAAETDDATLATVWDTAKKLRKRPVLSADAPAFIVNRVLTRMTTVLMDALENGNTVEETDEAILRLGLPMAPSVLLQMVGPRVANHVLETLHEAFPDRFPLSETLRNYAEGRDEIVVRGDARRSVEEIQQDALEAIADEVNRMLEEGVIAEAKDVDTALILGAGWPFWLGGITKHLDQTGISERLFGHALAEAPAVASSSTSSR